MVFITLCRQRKIAHGLLFVLLSLMCVQTMQAAAYESQRNEHVVLQEQRGALLTITESGRAFFQELVRALQAEGVQRENKEVLHICQSVARGINELYFDDCAAAVSLAQKIGGSEQLRVLTSEILADLLILESRTVDEESMPTRFVQLVNICGGDIETLSVSEIICKNPPLEVDCSINIPAGSNFTIDGSPIMGGGGIVGDLDMGGDDIINVGDLCVTNSILVDCFEAKTTGTPLTIKSSMCLDATLTLSVNTIQPKNMVEIDILPNADPPVELDVDEVKLNVGRDAAKSVLLTVGQGATEGCLLVGEDALCGGIIEVFPEAPENEPGVRIQGCGIIDLTNVSGPLDPTTLRLNSNGPGGGGDIEVQDINDNNTIRLLGSTGDICITGSMVTDFLEAKTTGTAISIESSLCLDETYTFSVRTIAPKIGDTIEVGGNINVPAGRNFLIDGVPVSGGGGGTSFIGFQADADLDMDGRNIINVADLCATGSLIADFLEAKTTGTAISIESSLCLDETYTFSVRTIAPKIGDTIEVGGNINVPAGSNFLIDGTVVETSFIGFQADADLDMDGMNIINVGDLCATGSLVTDSIEPKNGNTITVDESLCITGTLLVDSIDCKENSKIQVQCDTEFVNSSLTGGRAQFRNQFGSETVSILGKDLDGNDGGQIFVRASNSNPAIRLSTRFLGSGLIRMRNNLNNEAVAISAGEGGGSRIIMNQLTGNQRIILDAGSAPDGGAASFCNNSGSTTVEINGGAQNSGGDIEVKNSSSVNTVEILGVDTLLSGTGGQINVNRGDGVCGVLVRGDGGPGFTGGEIAVFNAGGVSASIVLQGSSGNATAVAHVTTSDDRAKIGETIVNTQDILDRIVSLTVRTYKWEEGYLGIPLAQQVEVFGLVGQEAISVFPEIVSTKGTVTIDGVYIDDFHTVNYDQLGTLAIAGIQELDKRFSSTTGTTTFACNVQMDGDLNVDGAFTNPSDARVKEEVADIPAAESLEIISKLQAKTYKFTPEFAGVPLDRQPEQIGFVAQDVQKVMPGVVHCSARGVGDQVLNNFLTLDYSRMVVHTANAAKALKQELDATRDELDTVKTKQVEFEAENKKHAEFAEFATAQIELLQQQLDAMEK